MPPAEADRLSRTLAALADPTRRAILARLAVGEATVSDLAAPFDMSLTAVSKHISVLEKAGLVAKGRVAQERPCRLVPEPLKDLSDWLEGYAAFLSDNLDRLGAYLEELQGKGGP